MKSAALLGIILAIAIPSVARAADVSSATVQGQIADWSLIQSKGGIQLGPAIQHAANSWKLSLVCDLSGNSSGLLIQKTVVQQEGRDIFISLVIGQTVWTLTPQRGQCHPVVIDSDPGVHAVFYRDAAGKTYPLGYAEFNLNSDILGKPQG
jgi:hypothetical protein